MVNDPADDNLEQDEPITPEEQALLDRANDLTNRIDADRDDFNSKIEPDLKEFERGVDKLESDFDKTEQGLAGIMNDAAMQVDIAEEDTDMAMGINEPGKAEE
jgi:hypothetical protein